MHVCSAWGKDRDDHVFVFVCVDVKSVFVISDVECSCLDGVGEVCDVFLWWFCVSGNCCGEVDVCEFLCLLLLDGEE